ncbi:MAG: BlaI/MecI/CopY family transcriptional regulator, partial [Terracidiphilus sp.]
MPPKRSITLTQAELRLMRVLWVRGESTVADMVTATADEAPLAYTSVLT